ALELFRRHRTVPMTLVLASAYAGWAGSLPPAEGERRLTQVLGQGDLPRAELVRGWLPSLLTESAPAAVAEELGAIMAGFHPAGVRAMARSFAEADLRDMLAHVDVPTLVLCGARDVRAPLDVARDLHHAISGSALVVMPDVGHQSNMETPERFTAELRRFLRAAPTSDRAG